MHIRLDCPKLLQVVLFLRWRYLIKVLEVNLLVLVAAVLIGGFLLRAKKLPLFLADQPLPQVLVGPRPFRHTVRWRWAITRRAPSFRRSGPANPADATVPASAFANQLTSAMSLHVHDVMPFRGPQHRIVIVVHLRVRAGLVRVGHIAPARGHVVHPFTTAGRRHRCQRRRRRLCDQFNEISATFDAVMTVPFG